jgi:hypothetical protein
MELLTYLSTGDPVVETFYERRLLGEAAYAFNSPIIQKYISLFDEDTKMWGHGVYSPKWTSTFYTLRDLMQLGIDPANDIFQKGINTIIQEIWGKESSLKMDICIVAMMISLLIYAKRHRSIIDEMLGYILVHQQADGGWNCSYYRHKTHKSSINTTLSVLEALRDYQNTYSYQGKLESFIKQGQDYLLRKKLFLRETTGQPIKRYIKDIHFPIRWQYDLYRGLEYFVSVDYPYKEEMEEALKLVQSSFRHGLMPKGPQFSGQLHFRFDLELYQKINTIRALSILKQFKYKAYQKIIHTEIKGEA